MQKHRPCPSWCASLVVTCILPDSRLVKEVGYPSPLQFLNNEARGSNYIACRGSMWLFKSSLLLNINIIASNHQLTICSKFPHSPTPAQTTQKKRNSTVSSLARFHAARPQRCGGADQPIRTSPLVRAQSGSGDQVSRCRRVARVAPCWRGWCRVQVRPPKSVCCIPCGA